MDSGWRLAPGHPAVPPLPCRSSETPSSGCSFTYSLADWYHPDYPLGSPGGQTEKTQPNMPRYFEYVRNQTRELIDNYGPLGVMWFDGEWEEPWTREYGNDLYAYLKDLQPSLLINNRVSKGRQGAEPSRTGRQRHG